MTKNFFKAKNEAQVQSGNSKMGITQVAVDSARPYAKVRFWNGQEKYYRGNNVKTDGYNVQVDGHAPSKSDCVSASKVPTEIRQELNTSSFKKR